MLYAYESPVRQYVMRIGIPDPYLLSELKSDDAERRGKPMNFTKLGLPYYEQ